MRLLERPTDTGGLTLAVHADESLGNGTLPPILLVHGMGSDHRTWRSFGSTLRRNGRSVIAVDLRGHGRSGRSGDYALDSFAADLSFVLDELEVAQAEVVGHSLGAHTALRLAMSEPARVRSLVLEEVPPMRYGLDDEIVVTAGFGEKVRGLGALLANPMPVIRFDRAVADQVEKAFALADPAWWDRLSAVSAPTLVISGGTRSFLPTEHLADLSAALPEARLEVIETGHSVHRDRRRKFACVAGEFLSPSGGSRWPGR